MEWSTTLLNDVSVDEVIHLKKSLQLTLEFGLFKQVDIFDGMTIFY